jgi:hypothetical protein
MFWSFRHRDLRCVHQRTNPVTKSSRTNEQQGHDWALAQRADTERQRGFGSHRASTKRGSCRKARL